MPGLYTVEVSAPHYESARTRVQVGFRDNATADTIQLSPAPVITGNITAAIGTPGSRTCIWSVPAAAVPDGSTAGDVVGPCTPSVPADCTAATVTFNTGATGPQCASVPGLGRYEIEVPRRGQYFVVVKASDTEYVNATDVRLNVPSGSTLVHNVQLNRYGRVTLTALVAGSGGALQATSGATLTLTQGATSFPTDPAGSTSTAEGLVFFKRLLPGIYTVNGTNGTRASDPFNVVVGFNQEVERIVPLIRRVSQLIGRVSTNIGGDQDVAGADVQVIGPVGYSGTQPFNGSVTARTASDGCFVVTRATASPVGVGDCTGTYANGPNLPWQRLDLLSNTVSEVRISKIGYDTLIQRNVDLDEADVNQFTLEPSAVTFIGNTAGTRITAEGAVPNYANATFSVDSTTTSAATITVKAAANGDLTWTDTRYTTTNRIRPGSYTIAVSMPGYINDTVDVVCAVATTTPATLSTCSPPRNLVLRQHGSLRVNAVDASSSPVNDVVATLTKGGATVGQRSSANDGNNVTFPDVLPGATDYALRVQAAGFDFDATALSCTPEGGTASSTITIEAGKLTTCTVTLTRLGTFTGTLKGVLADAPATDPFRELAGATVQATPCTAPATPTTACTTVDPTRRLTATTNAAGQYSISGTNRIEGIGQGWWLLTTVLPGWSQAAAASGDLPGTLVNVTTGGNLPQDLTMYVNRVNFTARINDQGGARVDDATVKLLQGATEVATGTLTGSGTTAQYDFTNVLPGFYTLEMTGAGLVRTTVQVEIAVGVANQSFQAFVSRASNSVSARAASGCTTTTPTIRPSCAPSSRRRAGSPHPGRVVACFQPHLYSRTRAFAAEFGAALGLADEVVVMDVFAAREDPVPGVTGGLVAAAVPLPAAQVAYEPSWSAVPRELARRSRAGDVVITFGAGDVTLIGPEVLELLAAGERADEPVGAPAACRAAARSSSGSGLLLVASERWSS